MLGRSIKKQRFNFIVLIFWQQEILLIYCVKFPTKHKGVCVYDCMEILEYVEQIRANELQFIYYRNVYGVCREFLLLFIRLLTFAVY